MHEAARASEGRGRVGYVLKGYPRLSEVFITSEIYRVERLGVPLRLYVLKAADEEVHHDRSEEHTSELQSRQYLVCRLLLEKKKIRIIPHDPHYTAKHSDADPGHH